jgi:arabinofuranosyltransferase
MTPMSAPEPDPPLPRPLRPLLAVPVVVLAAGAWSHRWMADDAFINLRIVEVTLRGDPFAFNPGERVEAGTSPLWIALLTVARVTLGWAVDLAWIAVAGGLALTLLGLVAAVAAAVTVNRADAAPRTVWPAGALVLAALPPMWDFATSGLETGLTFAWLGGCHWLLGRRLARGGQRPPWWLPVVLGLGPLIRPDLALFSVAFVVVLVVLSGRGRLAAVGWALLPAGVFEVFRMAWFASLVPNPALAKEAGGADWGQGLAYLDNLVRPYGLVLPLVLLAVWAASVAGPTLRDGGRRLAVLVAAPVLAGIVHGVWVLRIGGDFMHGRLLLPALFAVLLPVAALPLPRPGAVRWLAGAAAAGVATWAVVCAAGLRVPDRPPPEWAAITDERAVWNAAAGEAHAITLDDHARTNAVIRGRRARQLREQGVDAMVFVDGHELAMAPGSGVVLEGGTIGLQSVAAGPGVRVLDVMGLADAFGGRIASDPAARIGHRKALDPAYVLARVSPAAGGPGADDARAALRCPAAAEVLAATGDPPTPGRLLRNLLRAPALTFVRFPADPTVGARCDG